MEIYKIDNSGCESVNITLSAGTCDYGGEVSYGGGDYERWWIQKLTITSNISKPVPVDVNIKYFEYTTLNGQPSFSGWTNTVLTLPANQTSKEYDLDCRRQTVFDGGTQTLVVLRNQPTLLPQSTIPAICLVPQPNCDIEITGSTLTKPSLRGSDDGSIEVCLSGVSGTTTWNLNGNQVVTGHNNDCYVFTGLTSGSYTVLVEDSGTCIVQEVYVLEDGEFRTGDFVVSEPNELTAVENPIVVGVGTAVLSATPKANKTQLTITSIINNQYVKFSLTSPFVYNKTFYSKSFPNKPNYFLSDTLTDGIGTPVGSNTMVEVATSLVEVLNNDVVISNLYYVDNIDNIVTLTAKQNGSKFDLSTSNISTNASITIMQLQAGVDAYDGQTTDNYNISCEVLVNNNSDVQYPNTGSTTDYNRVAELVLPFSNNNVHRFNLSGILKPYVNTPMPDVTLTGSSYLPNVMKSYYCKIGELYPLIPNTNTVKKRYKTTTAPAWTINSSIDKYGANNMDDYTNTPVKFLTNSPSVKIIQREDEEYLYYILPKDYGSVLDCRGDIGFYDGTSITGETFFSITTGSTNVGGVMVLNLSYDKLGLDSYEVVGSSTRKIKYVDIAVYGSGGTVQYTEKKRYKLEIDEIPNQFSILFQNSLGMYDSFSFIGIVEETISRDTGDYTVPIKNNIDGSISAGMKQDATYNTKVRKKVILNSGWINEEHFDWLIELMKSNNIFSNNNDGFKYLNLNEYTYKKDSLNELFDLEVTFDYTIYENSVNI